MRLRCLLDINSGVSSSLSFEQQEVKQDVEGSDDDAEQQALLRRGKQAELMASATLEQPERIEAVQDTTVSTQVPEDKIEAS